MCIRDRTQGTLADTPLAMVKGKPKEGQRVMILFDCNTYGITDVQAHLRHCPIGKDKLETAVKAVIAARHDGNPEPQYLNVGEMYVMISPVDRKRAFVKAIKNVNMEKETKDKKNKIFVGDRTLTLDEELWRARKSIKQGMATLTQHSYIVCNKQTLDGLKRTPFPVHSGSTKSDVMGNIKLDPVSELPKIATKDIKSYFGPRYVLAGGKADTCDSDENNAEDSQDEDVVEPEVEIKKTKDTDTILAIHALPTTVITDLMSAYEIKHVIDMWPTPMNLAKKVVAMGGSYVGVCSTPEMKKFLYTRCFNDVLIAKVTPTERLLYDPRFTTESAQAGIVGNLNHAHP